MKTGWGSFKSPNLSYQQYCNMFQVLQLQKKKGKAMSSHFSSKFKTRKLPLQPGQIESMTQWALCCHTSYTVVQPGLHLPTCLSTGIADLSHFTAQNNDLNFITNSSEKSKSVNFSVITPVKVRLSKPAVSTGKTCLRLNTGKYVGLH